MASRTRSKARTRKQAGGRTTRGRRTRRPARTGAVALLKQDHREVEKLFKRFNSLGERAEKSKRAVVDKIVRELSVHTAIEEQVLYPVVREKVAGGASLADHAVEEHQKAKELLLDIDGMEPSDTGFDRKVMALEKDIAEHVEEEEEELFPKLAKATSREELLQMADAMRAVKKIAPTRPHPRAPSTPPANVIAGLAAGAIDRVRDTGRSMVRKARAH